jgi:ribonucleoside-triphosphate reductase
VGGVGSFTKVEEDFLQLADWEVLENANMTPSPGSLFDFVMDKVLKTPQVLSEFLPGEAVEAHFSGDIHIHKLPYSLWIPYCTGWSTARLVQLGLRTPSVVAAPPRHFDSALSQLVDFLYVAQQEWTGAQALSAVDLYLAPFVERDGLPLERVRQRLQSMLYQLNVPARIGMQTPFTNITLVFDTSQGFLEAPAVVGGVRVGSLGDFVGEALVVGRALFELYSAGDAVGQPFTFPIPTLMLTRNFDWSGRRWGELTDLIFEAVARKGTAYFLNGYASNVEALYAMCCRLTIDVSKLELRLKPELEEVGAAGTRGIWAIPDGTGSIGVVTVNLPRIAFRSRGEWASFEEEVERALSLARSVLAAWRRRYEKMLRAGLMPLTRLYLGHLRNHYGTFGIIGLPEAAANFLRSPRLWLEGSQREMLEAVSTEKKMVEYVVKRVRELEELDGVLYNVEEVPGESAGYRLALADSSLFRESAERGELCIPSDGSAVFYSNSVVPYYADVPLHLRALWEGEVQQLFTGGVMMHVFLGEQPDPEALRKLVHRLATTTKLVYFSITPTLTTCTKCGRTTTGYHEACPHCGNPNPDHWSRIVGYYRPVKNWNPGKKAEFKMRKQYGIESLK